MLDARYRMSKIKEKFTQYQLSLLEIQFISPQITQMSLSSRICIFLRHLWADLGGWTNQGSSIEDRVSICCVHDSRFTQIT